MVFGRDGGFAMPVDLADIAAGTGGFKIQGENASISPATSVASAGDVNGDGIDDLIIGAPQNDSGGTRPVRPMWCSARPAASPGPVDLDDIAAGTGGFKIQGESAYDRGWFSVSAAGDVNGDGIDDLIVGAPGMTVATMPAPPT